MQCPYCEAPKIELQGDRTDSISAQTVRNRLRKAGLRACRPVVRQVFTRHHNNIAYGHKPTVAGPERTGKKCSSLTSCGFVSPGVMVRFAFIVEANLLQSMRRRCAAVLNAAGGHTRY